MAGVAGARRRGGTARGGRLCAAAARAVAACSATASGRQRSPAAPAARPATASPASAASPVGTASGTGANWPEYDAEPGADRRRHRRARAGPLTTAWTAHLDGAVYGQPLVVGGEVIAATENDSVYALNRVTGKTIWRTHVGAPVPQPALHGCGNIFPLGITGTPVYDPGNGLVYAVAEVTGYHHMLVALDAATGAVRLRRDLDSPTAANQPAYNQQRPGARDRPAGGCTPPFGGLSGDCGAYQGSVVSAPLTGDGPAHPAGAPRPAGKAPSGRTGGPVVGPDGDLWVSVGNGAAGAGDPYDGSDSVTELSPGLQRLAFFAPATWADDNANDLDLGSTPAGPGRAAARCSSWASAASATCWTRAQPRRDRRPARRAARLRRLRRGRGQRVGGVRAVPERRRPGRRPGKRGEQDDQGAVARPRRRQRLPGRGRRGGLGHQLHRQRRASSTSSARRPGRSSSRSRSATACRTSPRCRSAAAPPTSARWRRHRDQRRLTGARRGGGAGGRVKPRHVRTDTDFEL